VVPRRAIDRATGNAGNLELSESMSWESELKPKLDSLFQGIPEGVDTTKLRQAVDGLLGCLKKIDRLQAELERTPGEAAVSG